MKTLPRAAVWTFVIALSVLFVFVGASKLLGPSAARWNDRFIAWGYPAAARYVIGTLEVAAGVGLLIPAFRRAAAATLVVVTIGAIGTHVVHAELPRVVPPLVLGAFALAVLLDRSST